MTTEDDLRLEMARLVLRFRELGIADRRVLKAMETIPRELFVTPPYRSVAYEDEALPIDCGQTISAPSIVAIMSAALDIGDRHTMLEIGTGTGYQTAILSRLARRVTTIERHRPLLKAAEARLASLGISNVSFVYGDGMLGWPAQAPFDRILVAAAAEQAPSRLIGQLADHGLLVVPIGPLDGIQRLTLFTREGTRVATKDLGAVRFVPLVPGVAQPDRLA